MIRRDPDPFVHNQLRRRYELGAPRMIGLLDICVVAGSKQSLALPSPSARVPRVYAFDTRFYGIFTRRARTLRAEADFLSIHTNMEGLP